MTLPPAFNENYLTLYRERDLAPKTVSTLYRKFLTINSFTDSPCVRLLWLTNHLRLNQKAIICLYNFYSSTSPRPDAKAKEMQELMRGGYVFADGNRTAMTAFGEKLLITLQSFRPGTELQVEHNTLEPVKTRYAKIQEQYTPKLVMDAKELKITAKKDLKRGVLYTITRQEGRYASIMDFGSQYYTVKGQKDTDCLVYQVFTSDMVVVGKPRHTTRDAFLKRITYQLVN